MKCSEIFEKVILSHSMSEDLLTTVQSPKHIDEIRQRIGEHRLESATQKRLESEVFGLGPIESLIQDPQVSEIIVQGIDNIWLERQGHFVAHTDHFWHPVSFNKILAKITSEAQLRFDRQSPCAQGTWREFRLQITSPPITKSAGYCLRRQCTSDWRLQDFVAGEWCTQEQADKLTQLIHEKKNLLVFGATGSGKTSTCNVLLKNIPENERVLLLQENDEMILPNRFSNKLFTQLNAHSKDQYFDLQALVKLAMRLRPQRIVVGEVRGSEAKDLLLALSTGHSGGMTTLHAKNAREALWRLQMLVQMGAPQWGEAMIQGLIATGIDYLIGVEQKQERRKLTTISKVSGIANDKVLLHDWL